AVAESFWGIVAADIHSTALWALMAITTAKAATTHHNFIDGNWVPSVSGDVFENRNPANTDDLVGIFQKSTPADVEQAVGAARLADERWRLVPAPKRAERLVVSVASSSA